MQLTKEDDRTDCLFSHFSIQDGSATTSTGSHATATTGAVLHTVENIIEFVNVPWYRNYFKWVKVKLNIFLEER